MTSGHRAAHVKAVVAAAILTAALLAYGWTARAARPVPQPLAIGEPSVGEAVWEVGIETDAGSARVALARGMDGAPALRVSLPGGLDAAEPGLVLEGDGGVRRVLGSIGSRQAVIPLDSGLPGGGRLVLVDLARDLRLGEAAVPEGGS